MLGKTSPPWRWEEKGTTEDEMVGWHHRLNGHEFWWTSGVGDGQGGLACCSPWGPKRVRHDWATELNWTEIGRWSEAVLWGQVRSSLLAVLTLKCLLDIHVLSRQLNKGIFVYRNAGMNLRVVRQQVILKNCGSWWHHWNEYGGGKRSDTLGQPWKRLEERWQGVAGRETRRVIEVK